MEKEQAGGLRKIRPGGITFGRFVRYKQYRWHINCNEKGMKTFISGGIMMIAGLAAYAQSSDWVVGGAHKEGDKFICTAIVENGDTIPYLTLPEYEVRSTCIFKTEKERQKWNRLKWNVKKVYPYACLASIKLKELDAAMANMKESEREKYMKNAERELKKQFEKDLQDLTLDQGRILIRLIDRETGITTYSVVKELRGSFQAFMWQSFAALFGSSLKSQYDPSQGEDKQIEQIIHLIENGQI